MLDSFINMFSALVRTFAWQQAALLVAASTAVFVVLSKLTATRRISLKGKHLCITGGSSGIGLWIAKLAALKGARVSILARRADVLALAKAEVIDGVNPAPEVFTFSVDVTDAASVAKGIAAVEAKFGAIDVLVCSQGLCYPQTFEEVPLEGQRRMMEVNYWGSVHTIRAALPAMRQGAQGGRKGGEPRCIALVSSMASLVCTYGYGTYGATKAALNALAESLNQELRPYNIRTCLIYPPDTATPGFDEENKLKSELCKVISGSGGSVMHPRDVGAAAVRGIEGGTFQITANFDGFSLKTLCAGMTPARSLGQCVGEMLMMPILRFVAFCYVWDWNRTIDRLTAAQKKKA